MGIGILLVPIFLAKIILIGQNANEKIIFKRTSLCPMIFNHAILKQLA